MNSNVKIFSGRHSVLLANKIASFYGLPLGSIVFNNFSDGEFQPSYEETVRGQKVFIIQSTPPPFDNLLELLLMIDAAKRASAREIIAVVPYFGMARQDRKDKPRVPIGAKLIANLIEAAGATRLITMDLHADQIQGFFSQPVDHLTALPMIVEYFKKKKLQDLVVVAPDAGRAKHAKRLADHLRADLAFMHKTRPRRNVAEVTNIVGDVTDKTVLLIDDMVDTGGSVSSCVSALQNFGAREDVYLATTHAVFSGPAVERLSNAGFKEVVVTDTMPIPAKKQFEGLTVLSTAKVLAEAVQRNYEKKSISTLYL